MASRSQITRLGQRIEALAEALEPERPVVFIWQPPDLTEDEACEFHYRARPEDRSARLTYVVSWISGCVDRRWTASPTPPAC